MTHRKIMSEKSGMAMLSVILFFLVLVILLAGVMNSSVVNLNNTQTVKENTAVYYAAETGINKQSAALQALVEDTLAGLNGRTAENFETNLAVEIANINSAANFTNSLGATIDMSVSGTAPNYTLRSVANIDGVSRVLETNFSYVLGDEDVGQAIVTEGGFTSKNNNTDFTFPISALLLNNTTLDIRNCGTGDPDDGNKRIVYVPTAEAATRVNTNRLVCSPGITTSINPNLPGWNSTPKGFTTFSMPAYPTYTVANVTIPSTSNSTLNLSGASNTYYINSFQLNSAITNLTINLGNKGANNITTLIVNPSNTLTSVSANINVTGQGKLKVYLKFRSNGNTTWGGAVTNSENDTTKFQLYAYNTSTTRTLIFPNGANFIGSILNQSNRFSMANGNFQGYYMSGCTDSGSSPYCVSVTSNTQLGNSQGIWIYVPNGTIYLSSNAYVLGSVIASNVILDGGSSSVTEIIYKGISQEVPFTEFVDLPLPTFKVLKSATFGNVVEK